MSFIKIKLDIENAFENCSKNVIFEDVAKGRKGAVLVDIKNEKIPIVRTTTKYNYPAQQFTSFHKHIIQQIKGKIKEKLKILDIQLNNCLIETYDNRYTKMGFHSDQALDLLDKSFICVFSCYENDSDNPKDHRKLVVQNKTTNKTFQIIMENNSVILFSTDTNRHYKHKIILNIDGANPSNKWLGMTLRTSKTIIKFTDDKPCFEDSSQFRLANQKEKKEFYVCKGRENADIGYIYPRINFTISASDLMYPLTIEEK